MDLCDIRTVRQVMAMFNRGFRKEFGQNFLTDRGAIEDIACAGRDRKNATVLEIGPGIGTLTRELSSEYKNVIALEIDRDLIPILKYTLSDCPNVKVYNEDVMQANLTELLADAFASGPVSVCANLPYYITSPILMKLLESGLPFREITVMVQAEVADRICASAGSKAYGAITAVIGYYGLAERILDVPADRFVPAPKVDSSVVRITLYNENKPVNPTDPDCFFRVIKAAFGQRRKTLSNALSTGFPELPKEKIQSAVASVSNDPMIRGERLTVSDFSRLAEVLGG